MGRLFGTDGVRGVAGGELTPELALAVGAAAAEVLLSPASATTRPAAVVGRDPRPSGEFLEAAVVSGLLAAGVDVIRLGVVPTPAVALALAASPVPGAAPELGVMISASHNLMPDNGIKLFGAGGGKLTDATEDAIEAQSDRPPRRVTGADVGRIVADLDGEVGWYVERLVATLPHRLDGLRIVVDCANGAAVVAAPAAYRAAGADVTVINAETDGYRINDGCGATHLEGLQDAVRATGAAAGIAHDGDADRCLAVDAAGHTVDGDQIIAVLALAMREAGALRGDAVAATVMSNLGLRRALAAHGIDLVETAVGDRYVLEQMHADGLSLGGEQSGHLVLADHAPSGDGILTGLHLLARIAQTRRSLGDLASVVDKLPQVLVNVRVVDQSAALSTLGPLTQRAAAELGADGRVLVRASGTEPLIRIMVEATTESRAGAIAESLAAAARSCR